MGSGCVHDERGLARFELPGAEAHYPRSRSALPEHLRIELTLDLKLRSLAGRCATRLRVVEGGRCAVVFDAVGLEVERVSAAGRELPFAAGERELRVELGERAAGEQVEVEIAYRAAPRRGLYFFGPDAAQPDRPRQAWTQGQDVDSPRWFPCLDQPGVKASSEVIVTVPAPFVALSNGVLVSERAGEGGGRTFHWRQDVPHAAYLVTLVVGEFESWKEMAGPVALDYHVPPGRREDGERSFGNTARMVAFFSQKTGVPYPYPRYGQVCVTDFIFGGMENTTQTTLTDTTLHDARAHLDFSSEPLVAHELAHQWFGDLLTCRSWSDGWLNEGFATYFEALWREEDKGEDEFRYELVEKADRYFGEVKKYARPVVEKRYHEPIDIFDRHLYEKGALVLHMIRGLLGDERFFRAIGHYARKHARGAVETRDLARAIEEATGSELSWLFDGWIHGRGHPELEVAYGWDRQARLVRLSVKQVQKGEGVPLFRTPLEIRMVTGGVARTFQVELAPRAEQAFAFPSEVEPDQLIVDPKNWVLKGMRLEKPAKLWRAELERAPEGIARALAARGLGRVGSVDDVPALRAALLGFGFWGVAAEAAGALGELRGPAAREALLAGLAVSHPKARRAVVKALGSFRGDAGVATVLIELLSKGDASYFVEAEAARSLGRTRDPRAVEVLSQVRERPSFQGVIRSGAVEGLAATRDERALGLVLAETAAGLPMQSRRAAAGALAEFEGKREVCERLEELLEDVEFRVRAEAAERLGGLGEARAVPALERVLRRADEDGRVKRRARESLAALAAGKKPDGLRAEVDALRAEVSRLRDEVAALQAPGVKPEPAPASGGETRAARGGKAAGKRGAGEKKAPKKKRVH